MRFFLLMTLFAFTLGIEFPSNDYTTLIGQWADSIHHSKEKVLVEFMAPWCGACKSFAAKWEKIVEELKGKISVQQINCEVHKNACLNGYNIESYPTLKLFQDGKETKFAGQRSFESVVEWALTATPDTVFTPGKNAEFHKNNKDRKPVIGKFEDYSKEGSNIVVMTSEKEFEEKTNTGLWLMQLYIGSGFDKEIVGAYLDVAKYIKENHPTVKVGVVNVYPLLHLAPKYEVESFPSILMLENGAVVSRFPSSTKKTSEEFTKFVNKFLTKEQSRTDL